MDQQHNTNCPINCPNRMTRLGKGYTFLFCTALTGLLAWQSCSIKYNRGEGLEFQTKEVPLTILVPCLFLIAGAAGINTDAIAKTLGDWLSRGK